MDTKMPGIHVRYTGEEYASNTVIDAISTVCPAPAITGPIGLLGTFTVDEYFSKDGAYQAKYTEGYLAKPTGPCKVSIEPYKKILLYHFGTRTLYEFSANGNKPAAWKTRPLPGERVAAFTGNTLDSRIGKVVKTGKSGKYAGLECVLQELHTSAALAGEDCVRVIPKGVVDAPFALPLMRRAWNATTGKQITFQQAQSVDLKADLALSVFLPPEEIPNATKAPRAIPGPMQKWCEKQQQTTGINPCKKDPKDDGS
jgi:hypothetical protein